MGMKLRIRQNIYCNNRPLFDHLNQDYLYSIIDEYKVNIFSIL